MSLASFSGTVLGRVPAALGILARAALGVLVSVASVEAEVGPS